MFLELLTLHRYVNCGVNLSRRPAFLTMLKINLFLYMFDSSVIPLAIFSFFCLLAFPVNLLLIISNVVTECEALCNFLLKSAIQTEIIILRGILSL